MIPSIDEHTEVNRDMVCICGHENHADTEPTVCSDIFCKCEKYVEATEENQVRHDWDKYVQSFNAVKEQMIWLLDNLKFLRNMKNKDLQKFYREKIKYVTKKGKRFEPDSETIRRVKQKLVEDYPERFGPFEAKFQIEKNLKQIAIEEWITQ